MSFDLKRIPTVAAASEQGFSFEPVYPGGTQAIGATITVRGPRSAAVREHARRKYGQAQAREQAARKVGRPSDPLELDDLDESLTELAVVYTIGWAGVQADGLDVPFSPDAARGLYADHPWLREQVIEQAQDLGKFIRPWSKNSSSTPAPSSAST